MILVINVYKIDFCRILMHLTRSSLANNMIDQSELKHKPNRLIHNMSKLPKPLAALLALLCSSTN